MLVADGQPGTAKLRVLLVTPSARGLGMGTHLVEEALAFARAADYRCVTLWTTDNLTSARKIYQRFGFVLTDEKPHRGSAAISSARPGASASRQPSRTKTNGLRPRRRSGPDFDACAATRGRCAPRVVRAEAGKSATPH
ncbi:GNAT family N-acetyltransferase [Streptomyces sp. NPDC001741]|uniref:GNAT family N-acetyltransferase n=1 Tax=Streptomyces sp. NPDC001741 TaxID=3364605 RepID=UPI00368905F9